LLMRHRGCYLAAHGNRAIAPGLDLLATGI
jgi:hypothetical protein